MTTVEELRALIVAKMNTVSGMGAVNDHEVYAKEQSAIVAKYASAAQGGSRIYGWYVRRWKTVEQLVSTGRDYQDHYWRIRGFMSVNEADVTEILFDEQIEAIRTAFRADPTLGNKCDTQFLEANADQAGPQLEESEPVLFCGVLCHAARLGLITRVYTNT